MLKRKLLNKVDWNVLNTYIDNSLIIANKHPEYDIWILNYSPKVQSKKFWDEYTLSCRGLIIDTDGNILGRPLQKFFNYSEIEGISDKIGKELFTIFEKIDGSLIILFYYEKEMKWIIASRGSFISEHAITAEKILIQKNIVYNKLDKNYTYLFELIHPNLRIVVDYGKLIDLVLLTKIHTESGIEIFYCDLFSKYNNIFSIVKEIKFFDIEKWEDLKKYEENNKEGFVVRFLNDYRFKIKFDEYLRLHAILTNVSNITVWEHLMNNYNFDELIDRVPDEFYEWLKKTTSNLQNKFNNIERCALLEFIRIYYINEIKSRKEFADEALKTEYHSILFKIYDKKSYHNIIWKKMKPTYSKPFKDGYEIQNI